MFKIKNVKLYFLFALILAGAVAAPYLLHINTPFALHLVPSEYLQIAVISLVFINIIIAYLLFRTYKRYYFLFSIVLVIAIITPHILYGHLLIPENYAQKYAQSINFLLDLIMVYVVYFIFRGQIKKIKRERQKTEKRLLDSYKYIGQANRRIGLFGKFMNFLSVKENLSVLKEKDLFNEFLKTIINSVVKADRGLVRFIEIDKKRTIKEFCYSKNNDEFRVKLPNSQIVEENTCLGEIIKRGEIETISSDYNNSNIRCVLCYPKKSKKEREDIDRELLLNLLKQIHLLFIAMYSEQRLNSQTR